MKSLAERWKTLLSLGAAAVLLGRFVFWLVSGGLAGWTASQIALNDTDVAHALTRLPEMQKVVEDIPAQLESIVKGQQEVVDEVRALKAKDAQVVQWAEGRILELNSGLVCYYEEECRIWMRGKRLPLGIDCDVVDATPNIEAARANGAGMLVPTVFASGWTPVNLTSRFKTFAVDFIVPPQSRLAPGTSKFVAITVYANCGFAPEGELIERSSFRVPLEILAR